MTCRAGETFDAERTAAEVTGLLTAPVPAVGPTAAGGDPDTGEWTATVGAGFRIVPLREGHSLTGVYAPEWNDAVEAAEGHLAVLAGVLDGRLGPAPAGAAARGAAAVGGRGARGAAVRGAVRRGSVRRPGGLGPGRPRWPVDRPGRGAQRRDAPLVPAALVGDGPVTEPEDGDGPL